MDIDLVRLNFSPQSLQILNIAIAVIMFGVALDMHPDDFRRVLRSPRAPLIGLSCQFLLLPALAFALTLLLKPQPSIALGLILVASCPGGNFSNFLTHFGRGNVALSVTMSSISTAVSIIMTPLNLSFWGQMNPQTAALLKSIAMEPGQIFSTVLQILILPLILGMALHVKFPQVADKLKRPFQIFSLLFLLIFIGMALSNNMGYFLKYIGMAAWIVAICNAMALSMGYFTARLLRLPAYDARAVSIEVGIQNAGFGLILVFNFFNGLGGMALIAAWWGVWHLVSGLALASFWRSKPLHFEVQESLPFSTLE
jgi:bile acid:Na+ symporter, BASS family